MADKKQPANIHDSAYVKTMVDTALAGARIPDGLVKIPVEAGKDGLPDETPAQQRRSAPSADPKSPRR